MKCPMCCQNTVRDVIFVANFIACHSESSQGGLRTVKLAKYQ